MTLNDLCVVLLELHASDSVNERGITRHVKTAKGILTSMNTCYEEL